MYALRGRRSSRAVPQQLHELHSNGIKESGSGGSYSFVPRRLPSYKLSYVHCLLFIWLWVIYYGERYYPYNAMKDCSWGVPGITNSGRGSTSTGSSSSIARVALVADPQLVDDNTYPGRNKMLLSITKYIVDGYLRRNWVNMHKVLDPDATIFLGDLFDGGREWSDPVWLEEYYRFNRIFTKPAYKRTIMSLPGNHDIGYGDTLVPRALDRFKAYFGPTSSSVTIANHTFVLLDTISMTSNINASVYSPPREFLADMDSQPHTNPRFLLSHVPLYRDKNADCGKYRESKKGLDYIRGFQYQTLIPPDVSSQILAAVKPVAVFSGDDHDACHVEHLYADPKGMSQTCDEFTVKSFSMAMGIGHPGIQLITVDGSKADPLNPHSSDSYHTSICLMPSPFWAFMVYAWLGFFSFSIIVLFLRYPHYVPAYLSRLSPKHLPLSPSLPLSVRGSEFRVRQRSAAKPWKDVFKQSATVAAWVIFLFMWQHHKLFDNIAS